MWKDLYIGAGVALAVVLFAGAGSFVLRENRAASSTEEVSPVAAVLFAEHLKSEVVVQMGQPIEGFEPFMFLQAFPGLQPQDFDGVDALIGVYRYSDDELIYDLEGEPELHSAARTVSDEGMRNLLTNVAQRLRIPPDEDGAVERIMLSLRK